MLQQIINTNTDVHALDANKKGENDVVVYETSTEKSIGEGYDATAPRKKKLLPISSSVNESTTQGEKSSTLIAVIERSPQQMLDSISSAIKIYEDSKAARAKAKAMEELKMKASLKHLTPERVF